MARTRISDVAAAAGVSNATVSLVLNGRDARISPDTRERVLTAARSVGYTPNPLAQGLRTRSSRTVGLVSDRIATTPFAGRMLAGVQDVAREHGYLVFLVDTDGDRAVEREALEALRSQQVAALLYAAMWHRVVDPREHDLPEGTVLLDCRTSDPAWASVVPDERKAGRLATEQLIKAGHRRIAFLDTDENDPPVAAAMRHRGYLDALESAGLEADPRLHVYGKVSAAGAHDAVAPILWEVQRPTAIFCFNDRMAAGVYLAAHRLGLNIPADLSVMGFDDQQFVAAELDPPLSTMALPHYAMGRWAMERALGSDSTTTAHLIDCPLVERLSIGPPPPGV